MMPELERLKNLNTARWLKAKINNDVRGQFLAVAQRLVASKRRYEEVSIKTSVPWWFIAVIHERESGQNWSKSLAQGDPWNEVSRHVPAGRGPFDSWEDAAIDALVNCAPYAARNRDWSIGGSLTMLEQYNGLGYASQGVPSPYIWSGTDQYTSGKYIRDHVYDPNVVDRQLGCAGLLLAMKSIDSSVLSTSPSVGSGQLVGAPKGTLPEGSVLTRPKISFWASLMSWFRRT